MVQWLYQLPKVYYDRYCPMRRSNKQIRPTPDIEATGKRTFESAHSSYGANRESKIRKLGF